MTAIKSFLRPLERYILPTAMLELDCGTAVAHGNSRIVHAHPEYPDRLVKLPRVHHSQGLSLRTLRRKIRPSGSYKSFLRELYEYQRLARLFPQGQLPIPAIHGFVRTTLGIGLLVDTVTDDSGLGLAPTLERLLSLGTEPSQLINPLERLWRCLYEIQPSIGDLHPGNIVWGRCRGKGGLFVIDGLGRSVLFPVDLWSQRVNRSRLETAHKNLVGAITSVQNQVKAEA